MKPVGSMTLFVSLGIFVYIATSEEKSKPASARDALQPFNLLVGSWRGSGVPEGSREEKQKNHWTETLEWIWKFKGSDAWMEITFAKGKYFTKGELRYEMDKDRFQLQLENTQKEKIVFFGTLNDKQLRLERMDDKTKETQQLIFSLLHHNRFTYRYEVKPDGQSFFTKKYVVGATKEGESIADVGNPERECVVSGGTGTSTVSYKGKTYYVCCSGCRTEFNEDPEKYIKEFEAKRTKSKDKK
jgi:hypothetical protein